MREVANQDAALDQLFMQLRDEFVSEKKVGSRRVRARFLSHVKQGEKSKPDKQSYQQKCLFILVIVLSTLAVVAAVGVAVYIDDVVDFFVGSPCLVNNNLIVSELTRPLFNCELCRNMNRIERITNISRQEFLEKYAYTGIPVVISGATEGWKATDKFSYQYFKTLYMSKFGGLKEVDEACQFFNWGYPFDKLEDVFDMTEAQANLEPGEDTWYIGWSNCHSETAVELRKNYERPYFLPNESESSRLDWIFMGWPGPGAFLHIDAVSRPSWQAQISGRKKWTFVPVPECGAICKDKYEVVVEKGDIIILDSNQWYHATYVLPGDISITIGSEYD